MPEVIFTESVNLETRHCPTCDVLYAVTQQLMAKRREDGAHWFCPNGHSLHFVETTASKLREAQRVIEQKQAEINEANARALRERALRQKGDRELGRQKKRAQNGVCSCCNRSFANLRRHMLTKHPEVSR